MGTWFGHLQEWWSPTAWSSSSHCQETLMESLSQDWTSFLVCFLVTPTGLLSGRAQETIVSSMPVPQMTNVPPFSPPD